MTLGPHLWSFSSGGGSDFVALNCQQSQCTMQNAAVTIGVGHTPATLCDNTPHTCGVWSTTSPQPA